MGSDLDGMSSGVDWLTAPQEAVDQARQSIHDLQMFSVAMEESKSGAGASAFGTGQATTAQLSNAADFAAGRDASIAELNSNNARLQSSSLATGAVLKRQSQINSVKGPSAVALALGLSEDGVKATSLYHSLKPPAAGQGGTR